MPRIKKRMRSRSGNVKQRANGRFTAYVTVNGNRRSIGTYETEKEAWSRIEDHASARRRPGWVDPDAGLIRFDTYAEQWIRDRPKLTQKSRNQYALILRNYLAGTFGDLHLSEIAPALVRSWYTPLDAAMPPTAQNSYRLLRAILSTAVEDELIAQNPCTIKGAGRDVAPERKLPTISQVEKIIAAMPENLRLAPAIAAWGTLRRGEVLGLQRQDIDLNRLTVHVQRSMHELPAHQGGYQTGPVKSDAGVRKVVLPEPFRPLLRHHLDTFVGPDPSAYLFTGRTGEPLRPKRLHDLFAAARKSADAPGVRFHDLRHHGATQFANAGANSAELKARGGWTDDRMVARYLHASAQRERELAQQMGAKVRLPKLDEEKSSRPGASKPSWKQRRKKVKNSQ